MKKLLVVLGTALLTTLPVILPVTSLQAAEPELIEHAIRGVKTGDSLNMRSAPGIKSSVIGRIPHDGRGIVPTGETQKIGRSTWVKVYWRGVGGWVNKYFLIPASQKPAAAPAPAPVTPAPTPETKPPAQDASKIILNCVGNEPFWRINIAETYLSVNMVDSFQYSVPVTFRQTSENNKRIAVIGGQDGPNTTQTFMQKVDSCSDSMSDIRYPYAITAVLNNRQVVSGCCKVQQK